MKLYTIGFAKKPAKHFFELLKDNNIVRVIDVRLNNKTQLSGFAKESDLRFFLREICDIDYLHYNFLAPTKEILDNYRKGKISWKIYKEKYLELLKSRNVINSIDSKILDNACLLCSEYSPEFCHRRILSEYFAQEIKELNIIHL